MLQKKSQTHVEIILSFTLFLSAVLIVFLFLNPITKTKPITTDTNKIKQNIIKQTSETIGSLAVIPTQPEQCYNFPSEYQTAYTSNFIEIQQNPRKYTLYFSDNLFLNNPKPHYDPLCTAKTYTFGIYTEEEIISYNKLLTLINNYNTDYKALKTTLQTKNDFRLTFKNLQDSTEIQELTIQEPKNIPQETNVQARQFPIRVIKDTGEIQEIILNIQTW